MKRLSALVLALVFVFSLTSCGPDIASMEPMEVLELSAQRMEKYDRFMMEMDIVIKMGKNEVKTESVLIFDVKNEAFSMITTSEDEELSYVYIDGWLYKDTGDSQIKYERTLDEVKDMLELDYEMVDVEDEDVFSDLELKENDDGTFTVSGILMDEEMIEELLGTKMDENAEMMMDYVVDKKGNLSKIVLSWEMKVSGIKIEMECTAKYTFKDVDKVTAPKDADDYLEMIY